MAFPAYILTASASLMIGTAHPVPGMSPSPPALPDRHVITVNFIDRLLEGKPAHRRKASQHRRKRPVAVDPAAPPPPDAPASIPVPLPKPAESQVAPDPKPDQQKAEPETKSDPKAPAPETQGETGDQVPKEPAKPDPPKGKDSAAEKDQQPNEAEPQPEIVHEDPADLKQCLSDLEQLGSQFKRIDPVEEENGCGIQAPIQVEALLPGLSLGGAVMRCRTALGLAHWLKDSVQPALDVAKPGRKITGIVPGTTFACRLRNNATTGMISEHARGNAFDIASFKLDNGETVEMKPRQDDHTLEGAFQMSATASACLYFSTVLAPGGDAAHETHLHVDVKDRDNGYRICESQ